MSHDRGCFRCSEDLRYKDQCKLENCPYKGPPNPWKKPMDLDETNDFGFSLVSEAELKAHEELLKKKVEEQSKVVEKTTAEAQDKLQTLRDMILPLLNNLSKDPDKTYILWPDRATKIKAFIKKINDFVDG